MRCLARAPQSARLRPFIKGFVHIVGLGTVPGKVLDPLPEAVWAFDFAGESAVDGAVTAASVHGIHERPRVLSSRATRTDRMLVVFSAYGLSRFSAVPMHELTNRIVDAQEVLGPRADGLLPALAAPQDLGRRAQLIEGFLEGLFREPSPADKAAFEAAEAIHCAGPENLSGVLAGSRSPSYRHLERKFKDLVGVNLRTFARLCRFARSRALLPAGGAATLTDVGYEAGYYDQAHFSREFKRFAGCSPRDYRPCLAAPVLVP